MGSKKEKSGLAVLGSAPLPEFQHPSHALLEEAGFNKILYSTFRDRCLAERADLGAEYIRLLLRLLAASPQDRQATSIMATVPLSKICRQPCCHLCFPCALQPTCCFNATALALLRLAVPASHRRLVLG